MELSQQPAQPQQDCTVPDKAIALARRVAGLQRRREASRHVLEIIMLADGTWLLMVDGSKTVEHLGKE